MHLRVVLNLGTSGEGNGEESSILCVPLRDQCDLIAGSGRQIDVAGAQFLQQRASDRSVVADGAVDNLPDQRLRSAVQEQPVIGGGPWGVDVEAVRRQPRFFDFEHERVQAA